MTPEILPLFSTPVYILDTEVKSFEKEIKFLQKLEYDRTVSNDLSKNMKLFDYPELSNIKSICEHHLSVYVDMVLNCKQEIYITNSWATKNSSGDSHHVHDHPNSIFSGVIYLQIPDPKNAIKFYYKSALKNNFNFFYSVNNYNLFNSDTWELPVKQGQIILFPSWLHHSVNVNKTKKDRFVIGFNSFVKGSFGIDLYSGDLTIK